MENNNIIYVNVDNIFTEEKDMKNVFKTISNVALSDEVETSSNDVVEVRDKSKNNNNYPNVFIRPVHCLDDDLLEWLKKSFSNEKMVLFKGYDDILEVNEQIYDISLHYLNSDKQYLSHLNKILLEPPRLFSIICDPLSRAVRNYNQSNSFNETYNFDEYYLNFGNLSNVGWTGTKDITNNYFANYLGFKNKKEITKENIRDKYAFILVCEKEEESYIKLQEAFNISDETINTISLGKKTQDALDVSSNVKKMFMENNILDYKLYELCVELLQDN